MTIEIRELIIEARVSPPPADAGDSHTGLAYRRRDEDALVRQIQQQVLRQVKAWLRDNPGGLR